MASVQYGAVLKPLRVLLHSGPMSGWSDGDLIERFLETDTDAAELAFAAIVDRHGPMVHRVCRQLLGDFHEAEDVFQARFFVERLRALILLCDLEGVTYEEAARQLRCPSEPSRAAWRGAASGCEAVCSAVGSPRRPAYRRQPAQRFRFPPRFEMATARAASRLTTGGTPTAGTVSTAVTTLMEGMIKSMIPLNLKTAAVLLGITTLGTGAGMVLSGTVGDEQKTPPRVPLLAPPLRRSRH